MDVAGVRHSWDCSTLGEEVGEGRQEGFQRGDGGLALQHSRGGGRGRSPALAGRPIRRVPVGGSAAGRVEGMLDPLANLLDEFRGGARELATRAGGSFPERLQDRSVGGVGDTRGRRSPSDVGERRYRAWNREMRDRGVR